MDDWQGNGPKIEEALGLFPRRPWYWPFSGTRHGVYRGYNVVVRLYSGADMPESTTFQVNFDRSPIGPDGFRRVRRLSPRRVAARVGKYRFTAHDAGELNSWLTGPRRVRIERMLSSDVWYIKRNWRQLTLHKFRFRATDVAEIRSGLDELLDAVEALTAN